MRKPKLRPLLSAKLLRDIAVCGGIRFSQRIPPQTALLRPTLTLSFTTASVLPTGPCATAEVIFGGRRLQCRRLHGLTYRGTVVISAHIHLTTQLEPLLLNLSKPTRRGLPDHFVLC